jgi:hypothetical protein
MVNIQGIEHPVVVVECDIMITMHKNHSIIGHWDVGTGIEINDKLVGDAALPILMHEILHGIDDALEIRLDEHQTQLLAVGFIQLMQANGGDVDWLRNMMEVEDE